MNKKALVVSIDNYRTSPLKGCENDANRLFDILSGDHCKFEVKQLKNEEVTRHRLREEIHWLFKESGTALLFFAGHGWKKPAATYLVTHDYEEHDEGIDLNWLANAANRLTTPSQTVLYVLDCCHSGDGSIRGFGDETEDFEPSELNIIAGSGRALIAACKGSEVAYEYIHDGKVHGAFSHYLCEALDGAAANQSGEVTLNAVFDYIAYNLKNAGRQTPVMRGDQEGRIVLASGVTKSGDWSPAKNNQLSIEDAISKADELLSNAHSALSTDHSFEHWQRIGFSSACLIFEPILNWFRRRVDSQSNLRIDQDFKKRYDSCLHFYSKLCSVSPGIVMTNGIVGDRIGTGSFGSVWKIEGSPWNKPICFKAYHSHDLLDSEKVSRFRRGYEAMRQLDHPNIVKVLALSEIPFGFFMEYIEGANVRALNPGSSLNPEDIVSLLLDVAETLKHAHGRGVIHRDVKPENILIQISDVNTYSAYLTDFDLAWFSAATQVTRLADGFGSHFYAAPEQINSPRSAIAHQATVDSYSFGQLCFFAVCGRDPQAFDQESNIHAISDALGRNWNDASASKQMLDLFSNCTRRNPRDRIQDFREVSEQLAKIRITLESGKSDGYETPRFLEQIKFNLGGGVPTKSNTTNSVTLRSRSGRTELQIMISKDADSLCAIGVTFRPNEVIVEGNSSSAARATVNQRIDMMLREFSENHDATRKGAKGGAFEFTVRIDRLQKNISGVLIAREVISRVIDLVEQA